MIDLMFDGGGGYYYYNPYLTTWFEIITLVVFFHISLFWNYIVIKKVRWGVERYFSIKRFEDKETTLWRVFPYTLCVYAFELAIYGVVGSIIGTYYHIYSNTLNAVISSLFSIILVQLSYSLFFEDDNFFNQSKVAFLTNPIWVFLLFHFLWG